MNNRDPFNLRRSPVPASNLFRSNAAFGQAAIVPAEKSRTVSKIESSPPNMSSYAPSLSGPTQRHPEMWQGSRSNGHANGSVGEKISEKMSGMFNSDRRDSLPMYKDKPRGVYPGSRRHMPWFRRKRTVALVLVSLAGLSWWFGILSPLSYFSSSSEGAPKKSKSSWSLLGSSRVDWNGRADKVRDAFKASFADYEKHGWGTCRVWLT